MAGVLAVILIVAADQLMKHWATANIALGESVNFIPGILGLTRTHNSGMAFGLLQNMTWLFLACMAVFLTVMVYLLITRKIKPPLQRWAIIAVIGGALGNAIDRAAAGYVVDMFEFKFVNFAIFNVADMFIVLGGVIFCVHYLLTDMKKKEKPDGEG